MSRNEHDSGFEHVTAQWLAHCLKQIQRDTAWEHVTDSDGNETWLDVRLQVANGDAHVHSGFPDYDLSHVGYWASQYLERDDDWARLLEIAQGMIEEARNQQADSQLGD